MVTALMDSAPPPHSALNLMQCKFERRELIPLHQNILWRIEAGIVRTRTWNEEKVQSTLGLWGKGDLIGEPLSNMYPYEIQCLTAVNVSIFPSCLWYGIVDNLISHVQRSENLLRILHCSPNEVRLQEFLTWLAYGFGQKNEQGYLIDLKLTHQEIAEVVGLSRVTVTRILNQLRRDRVLSWNSDRGILLHQPSP